MVDASNPDATSTLAHETGLSYPDTWVSGDWIKFEFENPVSLSASTTYGVDVEVTGGDWNQGIAYMNTSGNEYAGGARYSRADGDPSTISGASNDMIFHADIIPEPASMLLMVAAFAGIGVLRRKFQH